MKKSADPVFRFKSRFSLPPAEADFVCALALELRVDPDTALRLLIRHWAKSDPSFSRRIWALAKENGRGPWK